MEIRPVVCPLCGGEIREEKRAHRPFACHSCGRLLTISPLYFWIPFLGGALASSLLGYFFGVGDSKLVVFTVVLWLPASLFIGVIVRVGFPPKIREYHADESDLRTK